MADKKITELPFIDTLSGSLVGTNSPLQNTVIPIVLRGNTNQINIENFSKFVTQYSAHTGSAGNIFTGPQTINNNVTINGRLTVREVVAEYETASILFSTGSTKLGDEITDRHEFTGSTNITGSFIVNGANLTDFSASNSTLFTNYSSSVSESISSYSSSNSTTFTNLSSSNSTTFTNLSSSNSTTFTNLSSSNSTTFTDLSSSNSTLFTNYSSSVSQSISSYSSSNSTTFTNLSSSNSTTFTNYSSSTADSIDGLSLGIGTELARVYQTTASLNVQTGSQNSLNTSLGLITSSIYSEITSFNSVFQRIGSTTSSMNTQSGSQDLVNFGISTYTGSQNVINASVDAHILKQATQTGSQDLVNYNISIVTSSIDAHILGISIYTASANTTNTSIDAHILKQATQTGSQDLVNLGISSVTGSLIGITNGLMAFTAALDNTYATDAQLLPLIQATASLNTQTGSQDLVNLAISTFTGSLRSEVGLIEAYTASLKSTILPDGTDLNVIGNLKVTGSTTTDAVQFDRTAGINVIEGQMAWNNTDGTLDIGLNYGDVVLQVGQEQHYVVRNSTGTTIPNGTAVYASGVSVGSKRIEVSPFTANGTDEEIRFLGLATHNILDGVNGIVSNFGYVRGLDTRGTSATAISVGDETWAEGDILYAHPTAAGKLTNVAPKDKITVAMITTRHQTTGVLFVRPSSFGHIDDLHDVNINTASLSTGDLLVYDNNEDEWINTNKLTGSYGIQGTLELNGDILGNGPLNTFTGSLRSEVNLIEAYTASLKGAAIVSSSQQIQNYFTFARTGSANTFYANQTIVGSLIVSGSEINLIGAESGDIATYFNITRGSGLGFQVYDNPQDNASTIHGSGIINFRASGSNRMSIDNNNVTILAGNLAIGTAGNGIDFSATSNGSGTTTSELLNDYEEGTWTPNVVFVGTPGTVNYISRSGKYTKIGRVVHAEYQFTGCSITGSVGYATITGLPFTMNSTLGGWQEFAPYGGVNFPSSSVVYQQGGAGDTKIFPVIVTNSGVYADFTNSNINTGASFTVYALYTYST